MNWAKNSILIAIVMMTVVSCATIVGGREQMISVDSNVEEAEVFYNGAKVGTTPFNGAVDKAKEPELMVKKQGYRPSTQILSTSTATIFWGNIIFGGTLGSSTDYASGSMFEVEPKSYYINLKPKKEKKSSYDFDKDTEIKRFAMMNHDEIGKDLHRQNGEHLDSLLKLMELDVENRSKTTKVLAQMYRETSGSISFGEEVSRYYFENR